MAEHVKARQLSEVLDKEILDRQIIVSHTPLRALVNELKEKKVLVIGFRDSLEVARNEYGFQKAFSPAQVIGYSQNMYPFREYLTYRMSEEDYQAPWHAIMVFHDSVRYAEKLMVFQPCFTVVHWCAD